MRLASLSNHKDMDAREEEGVKGQVSAPVGVFPYSTPRFYDNLRSRRFLSVFLITHNRKPVMRLLGRAFVAFDFGSFWGSKIPEPQGCWRYRSLSACTVLRFLERLQKQSDCLGNLFHSKWVLPSKCKQWSDLGSKHGPHTPMESVATSPSAITMQEREAWVYSLTPIVFKDHLLASEGTGGMPVTL